MPDPEDEQLIGRAQELSDVIPLVELFQDLADEVEDWWASGLPESQIDAQIAEGLRALGWDTELFFGTVPGPGLPSRSSSGRAVATLTDSG